jgi:hypothetical protein
VFLFNRQAARDPTSRLLAKRYELYSSVFLSFCPLFVTGPIATKTKERRTEKYRDRKMTSAIPNRQPKMCNFDREQSFHKSFPVRFL